MLLAMQARAAPSLSSYKDVIGLWKVCPRITPNAYSLIALPRKEGTEKKWWESEDKILNAHNLIGGCQENKRLISDSMRRKEIKLLLKEITEMLSG